MHCSKAWYGLAVCWALVLCGPARGEEAAVGPPPADVVETFRLAPFYKKHLSVGGFPILASDKVPDAALHEAAFIVRRMLAGRDDVIAALVESRARLVIMAHDEYTTDVPEHSDLLPPTYWDRRARGLGATPQRPAVSCGAENLLCYPGDPYSTENILVHEFGHAIHDMGLKRVDPEFDARLQGVFREAIKSGLWKGAYAATNHHEYWAEGVQSWFGTNRENDDQHNHVNTRAELREYDPALARLLAETFPENDWQYKRPQQRSAAGRAHLGDYAFDRSPQFAWPERLQGVDLAREPDADGERRRDLKWTAAAVMACPPSEDGGGETSVLFINRRDDAVSIYWVDREGNRKLYHTLAAGQEANQPTFVGHAWLVTTADDKPLGHVVARMRPGRLEIPK